MKEEIPAFRKALGPWVPFAFCVLLCGLVMSVLVKTGKIETAYPAFFCFLPMAFFFVAAALGQIRKEIGTLSDRIQQLEKEKR